MKPRLYKSGDRWICFTLDRGMRKAAAGLCPLSAFKNWEVAYA